jgi:hypothetical protein
MSQSNKQLLLQRIAGIAAMERGKLSSYEFKERAGNAGPYYKLQRWENGKNHTRYVPADEIPALQTALTGYAEYEQLTEQYAELVIGETRQKIAGSKKNLPRLKSSSRKKRKSSN